MVKCGLNFLIIIFISTGTTAAAKSLKAKNVTYPYSAYLDAEEKETVQVFNYPAAVIKNPKHMVENWRYCKKIIDPETNKLKCENAVGWLPRDATIEVLGPVIVKKTKDWQSGDVINEEYVKVRFKYPGMTGDEMREGYIEAGRLTNNPTQAFFATMAKPEQPTAGQTCTAKPASSCANPELKARMKDPLQTFIEIKKSEGIQVNQSVVATAEKIGGLIGKCYNYTPKDIEKWPRKMNAFKEVVQPDLRKVEVPKGIEIEGHTTTNPKYLDTARLEAIDGWARTIYAEMGRCFRKGLQYPMAVAAIGLNRSEATCALKNAVFIQNKHAPGTLDITKVATTPEQFSLWKPSEGERKHGPLLQALCPPRKAGEPFYASSAASKMEADIWKNSVYIATQMVLFPQSFSNRTPQMRARYYYTSDMGAFYGLEKVVPSIEGRPLDNPKCMEIWRDMAKDHMCNGGVVPDFDKKYPAKDSRKPAAKKPAKKKP